MLSLLKSWLETYIWPWNKIAALRRQCHDLWDRISEGQLSYNQGYDAHWNKWIATTNAYYGSHIFDDNERRLMRRFYDEGKNCYEAIGMLKEYYGYGKRFY